MIGRTQKDEMEAFIEDRISGLRIPIDVHGIVLARFNILDVINKQTKCRAMIKPVKGGFIIETSVPKAMVKDFRFILAHEFAHTYFYELQGNSEIPKHFGESYEEELCDYGARALLIPKSVLSIINKKNIRIYELINLSEKLNVFPHWIVTRLNRDLSLSEMSFLTYSIDNRTNYLLLMHKISSINHQFTPAMLLGIRKIIKNMKQKEPVIYEKIYIGNSEYGGWFHLEIMEDPNLWNRKPKYYVKIERICY